MMHKDQVSLVGSIVERKPGLPSRVPSPKNHGSRSTGFPSVQHRSKSAFARARESSKNSANTERPQQAPKVVASSNPRPDDSNHGPPPVTKHDSEPGDWRKQMEDENQKRVESMTDEELEDARREILQKFGFGISEILHKVRKAREGEHRPLEIDTELKDERTSEGRSSRPTSPVPAHSALVTPGASRPPSRADRRLRFADLTTDDVYVYESAPPTPRKAPLALASPTEADGPTISLGNWTEMGGHEVPLEPRAQSYFPPPPSSDMGTAKEVEEGIQEGTPEDIRKRFFPSAPLHDPSLAWMQRSVPPTDTSFSASASTSSSTLRFDLTGTPIPEALSSALPTHLGLHHHSEGEHAGYSLEDIFMLSRSTVPAQRTTMFEVMSRIAWKLAKKQIPELTGQEEALRRRMTISAIDAMDARGSLGVAAVDVVWTCVVAWDEELQTIEGVELEHTKSSDPSSALVDVLSVIQPDETLLPKVARIFTSPDLPPESVSRVLAVLHRIAKHSDQDASAIVTYPGLVSGIFQTSILTPIPPLSDSSPPDPLALHLLHTLILASRTNATAVLGPVDSLLRFITTLPPDSPYPLPLAESLLTGTLRVYADLAAYGLYCQIATTATEPFSRLETYVLSGHCKSDTLKVVWLELLEAWIVCATDPHQTIPSHDILWSQVTGWGWAPDVLELTKTLNRENASVWTAVWRVQAAWLEGARVNAIKAGEAERSTVLESVKPGFEGGVPASVVASAGQELAKIVDKLDGKDPQAYVGDLKVAASKASTLAAAIRLWLACLPAQSQDVPETPPFFLPFAQISALCSKITAHGVWREVYSASIPQYAYVFCRPLSLLLSQYLELSRRLPEVSESLWVAQAFAIIRRTLPGDEYFRRRTLERLMSFITSAFFESGQWIPPPPVWDKDGISIIKPFLLEHVQPRADAYVSPLWITPQSIARSTTQRLTSASPFKLRARSDTPLPLAGDWFFAPFDHLLRSGQSEVFKSLPESWDASETELVRATLVFAMASQEALGAHGMTQFVLTREETVFNCMKVFMLEHGQKNDDSATEVFRDNVVGLLMESLVAPYEAARSPGALFLSSRPSSSSADALDDVAARFLGSSTPFYQWYTDFVALYDAISFSHPLFARLLLPPTSMRYPLDFRKYLWADYGHITKTIRTPISAMITGNVGEFLWPAETDAQITSAYLRALVRHPLEGFARFVAIHHVACNIWPDLQELESGKEQAGKLLRAVVTQCGLDVIREVVLYRQVRQGKVLFSPECFQQTGEWKATRLAFITQCGEDLRDRLKNLLE